MNFKPEISSRGDVIIVTGEPELYVVFEPGETIVSLDGDFEIEELEKIIAEMKNHLTAKGTENV